MIKLYLKQAWTLIKQNKLFTSIYVVGTGLSIALTMTMFIIFYVKFAPIYRLSGNLWLVSFKISYLCLPLFYETRTTPSCHPSGCAYRQL